MLGRRASGHPGFPALAGMDPVQILPVASTLRIPRARGDGPDPAGWRHYWVMDSPRSRGWTRDPVLHLHLHAGFPALAGMDPWEIAMMAPGRRIPRARGDGPEAGRACAGGVEDSPRSRGWTRPAAPTFEDVGGFPALAGMDPASTRPTIATCRIPRARGDGPPVQRQARGRERDSPRSRGWTRALRRRARRPEGFPALAGMDPRERERERRPRPGFPALAGMDPRCARRPFTWRGIPRARGDGPAPCTLPTSRAEDSPRSRGWTPGAHGDRSPGAGFPALAGMDLHESVAAPRM